VATKKPPASKKAGGEAVAEARPDRAKQVAQVIELIEAGSSENAACLEVGINRATFRAAALKQGAGDDYARALASLAHDQVEKVELAIQDMRDGRIDAQQARVEIDARKWFASKFLPGRYGDRAAVELTGKDGGPVQLLADTPEAREARIAELLAQRERLLGK
jgi:hypothetical protein